MFIGKVILVVLAFLIFFFWFIFRDPPHMADEYFNQKFSEPMSKESHSILWGAYCMRHEYPDLTGPELVRLAYWGTPGEWK